MAKYGTIGQTDTLWDQKVSVGCGTGSLMAVMISSLPSLSSVLASNTSSKDSHLHCQASVTSALVPAVTATKVSTSIAQRNFANPETCVYTFGEACYDFCNDINNNRLQ